MIDTTFTIDTLLTITERPEPAPVVQTRYVLRGDEELAEYNYQSRTSPANMAWKYQCTPSVTRYYPEPREKSGDYRVNVSPMRPALLALNGGDERKLTYLEDPETALYNQTGYPMQAYLSMQLNELMIIDEVNGWYKFKTLRPTDKVSHMTYESHPWFVHRFDLVCWSATTETTRHHPNTPRGILYFYLVSNEGYGYIPARYVKEVER